MLLSEWNLCRECSKVLRRPLDPSLGMRGERQLLQLHITTPLHMQGCLKVRELRDQAGRLHCPLGLQVSICPVLK